MSDARQIYAGAVSYFQAGQFDAAAQKLEQGLRALPEEPNLSLLLGIIRLSQNRPGDAVTLLSRVRARVGDSPALLINLGKAYAAQNQPAQAADLHRKAITLAPQAAEAHYNLGNALVALKKYDEALASYRRATALKPDFAQAHYNIGTLLHRMRDLDSAEAAFRSAIAQSPDYVSAHANLGTVLLARGKIDAAVKSYETAVKLASEDPETHYNLANALASDDRLGASADASRAGLEAFPKDSRLLSLHMHTVRRMCQWDGNEVFERALHEAALRPDYVGTTFPLLSLFDEPALHLAAARNFAANELPPPAHPAFAHQPHAKIRIGYCSADFSEHVMSHLFAGLFELHDREKFEIWGISIGADDDSDIRKRVVKSFDHFIDIQAMSDEVAAEKIRNLSLDIAVDLNGYTKNHRAALFAHRLAPIQVYYLIPGTTGAPSIDYILLDDFVAPEGQQVNYSEKVIRLPGCYWINDVELPVAGPTPTRAKCGLPEDAFVFCCFSNSYKITPDVFTIWMRVLHARPDSVLWLLNDNPWLGYNLRSAAERHDIDPDRLVFAPRAKRPEHLARHNLADLGLDTFPYNGHTTMSDAMWMGLPVITLAGQSFASRVAGSMLLTADMGELITYSLADYEKLALTLAGEQLQNVRQKLVANRAGASLFDARLKTRQIEQVFTVLVKG